MLYGGKYNRTFASLKKTTVRRKLTSNICKPPPNIRTHESDTTITNNDEGGIVVLLGLLILMLEKKKSRDEMSIVAEGLRGRACNISCRR